MVTRGIALFMIFIGCCLSASADAPYSGAYRGSAPLPRPHPYYGVPYPPERPSSYSTKQLAEEETDSDEDDDDDSSMSLVGSLLSLVPGGLSGILGLSSGSFRSKRSLFEPQTQADFVDYVLQKKKEFVSGIARDAIFYAHDKKPVARAWLRNKLYSLINGESFETPSYASISDYDNSYPAQYPPLEPPQESYRVPEAATSYGVPQAPVHVPADSYGVPLLAHTSYPYPAEHRSGAPYPELVRQYRKADQKEDETTSTSVNKQENGITEKNAETKP